VLSRQLDVGRPTGLGFTLIELAITIALLAVLVMLATPSFAAWIRNSQVRAVSEVLQNGLRTAQTEALRRNRQVVFSLTNDVPGDASTAVTNGAHWAIHAVPLLGGETHEFIEGGHLAEVASGVKIAGQAALCLNSAGRLVANGDPGVPGATCTLTTTTRYHVSRTGSDRPLEVHVSLGGHVRMCDPSRSLATSPDGCPQ
jgi:type IV fimbrial biogenesis protein FimT